MGKLASVDYFGTPTHVQSVGQPEKLAYGNPAMQAYLDYLIYPR
jgi:hypothetical protein